ncbi:MAG: hypothetical protein MRY21_07335 [Simkaniaceae bacterium]|nr:hypothetical protein [Simkaniaceae bacterium]
MNFSSLKEQALAKWRLIGSLCLLYLLIFIANVYFANLLRVDDFGDINVVFFLLVFFTPFAHFGTRVMLNRLFPVYFEEERRSRILSVLLWNMERFSKWAFWTYLGSSFLLMGLTIFQEFDIVSERAEVIIFFLWLIPLFIFIFLQSLILFALKFYNWAVFYGEFCFLGLLVAIGVVFSQFFQKIIPYERQFQAMLVIGMLSLAVIVLQFLTMSSLLSKKMGQKGLELDQQIWGDSSFKLMTGTVIFTGVGAFSITIAELVSPYESDVGFLAAILTVIGVMVLINGIFDLLLHSELMQEMGKEPGSQLQSYINQANTLRLGVQGGVALLLLLLGKPLLLLFGPFYAESYLPFVLFTIGTFIGVCFSSARALLLYSGNQLIGFNITIFQLILMTLLDFLLIPSMHLTGAGIALVISLLVSGIFRVLFVRKKLRLRSLWIF